MNADIHGLSGAYAVDALDDVERAAFERHLAQCRACQDEVASLRAAAAELPHLAATSPPPELRESVLRQISQVRPLPPTADTRQGQGLDEKRPDAPTPAGVTTLASRRRSPVTWLAAAAAAAVITVGGLVWSPWDDDQPQLTAAEQVVQAQDAQRFEKSIDGARATIVRSPSARKAVIIADNMPAAPEGRDFQLWLQQPDGSMVSAGMMPHEHGPTVSMVLEGDAATAVGAGITMEPSGGSPQPTSDPIALFEFS
jgi:anti-sigma-K factor RskA